MIGYIPKDRFTIWCEKCGTVNDTFNKLCCKCGNLLKLKNKVS